MVIVRRAIQVVVRGGLWFFYILDGFMIVELGGRFLILGSSGVKSWIFHIAPKAMMTNGTLKLPSASETYRSFFYLCLTVIGATACLMILDRVLWKPTRSTPPTPTTPKAS